MFYIFVLKLLRDIHRSLLRSFILAIPIFLVLLWIARTDLAQSGPRRRLSDEPGLKRRLSVKLCPKRRILVKPGRRPWHIVIKAAGLSLALAAILTMTLFNREIGAYSKSFELDFLWSYKAALFKGNLGLAAEILENILLFIPLGFMLPAFFTCFEKARNTVLTGLMLSSMVELIQGFTAMGLFEFDDIFNNSAGALIGFFLWVVVKKAAGIL